jgi:hypothetical protein
VHVEQHPHAVVRLQALDGTWETVGVDRLRGIVPEGIQPTSNEWGNDGLAFTLRRHPAAVYPDLTAFTPCEVEIGGQLIWTGRIRETPTREGDDYQINVQAQGWQYHLEDDPFDRKYLLSNLAGWKDQRSFPTAALTQYRAVGQVDAGDGAVELRLAQGEVFPAGARLGATVDLGPDNYVAEANWTFEYRNNSGSTLQVFVRGHDLESEWASTNAGLTTTWLSAFAIANGASGSSTSQSGSTPARRYVTVFLYNGTGANITLAGDAFVRFTKLLMARVGDYTSGGLPSLKASDVITDAVNTGCPLLSNDRSLVSGTLFNLSEYAIDGLRTPREHWQTMNAYHGYDSKIDVDKRPVFRPRPAAPLFEVGSWSGADFEDASSNSGEEIVNRVVVEGQGPDGSPLRVERTNALAASIDLGSVQQPSNPSAAVDASGWSVLTADTTFARTTTAANVHSPPGAFGLTPSVGSAATVTVETSVAQPLVAGRTYHLRLYWRTQGISPVVGKAVLFGVLTKRAGVIIETHYIAHTVSGDYSLPTAFEAFDMVFTPRADADSYAIQIEGRKLAAGDTIFFDTIEIGREVTTLVDRRGFRRTRILPVQSALSKDSAAQIGDVFLANHRTTPLKGSLRAQVGGVRRVLTGEAVHPSELLRHTGELIRFAHLIDPDTGGQGRDGRIASVSYDHPTETASVAIDNDRAAFDVLLARAGLLTAS